MERCILFLETVNYVKVTGRYGVGNWTVAQKASLRDKNGQFRNLRFVSTAIK